MKIVISIMLIGLSVLLFSIYSDHRNKPLEASILTTEKPDQTSLSGQAPLSESIHPLDANSPTQPSNSTVRADNNGRIEPKNPISTENKFLDLDHNSLDLDQVMAVFSSDRYYEDFNLLKEEQLSHAQATELTNSFSDLINLYAESSGNSMLELVDLSCGLQVCIGSLNSYDNGQSWNQLNDYLTDHDETSYGTMIGIPLQISDDTLEYRFAFTTQKSVNSITLPTEEGMQFSTMDPDDPRFIHKQSEN